MRTSGGHIVEGCMPQVVVSMEVTRCNFGLACFCVWGNSPLHENQPFWQVCLPVSRRREDVFCCDDITTGSLVLLEELGYYWTGALENVAKSHSQKPKFNRLPGQLVFTGTTIPSYLATYRYCLDFGLSERRGGGGEGRPLPCRRDELQSSKTLDLGGADIA